MIASDLEMPIILPWKYKIIIGPKELHLKKQIAKWSISTFWLWIVIKDRKLCIIQTDVENLSIKNSKEVEDRWISPRWLIWFQEESPSIWELLSTCFQAVFFKPLRLGRGSTHCIMAHGLFFVFFLCEVFKWHNQPIHVHMFITQDYTKFEKELIVFPASLWLSPLSHPLSQKSILLGWCVSFQTFTLIHLHASKQTSIYIRL